MTPITTEVVITGDHKLNLNIDLPEGYPTGAALVTVTVEPKAEAKQPVKTMAELSGKYEGQIWMSEDFDEPLKDFKEAALAHKPFQGLFGALKDKESFDGDGVALQRQWRDEWPE